MIKRRVLALMLLLLSSAALADSFVGQASVIDGDTLEIHGTRIRLWGVDAPESTQLCRGEDSSPVSSLHSVPRAAFGVAMLTLLRVPSLEDYAPLAHA